VDQKSLIEDLKSYIRDYLEAKVGPKSDSICVVDHFKILLAEIDKRYEQRFDAQGAATFAALNSAREATEKAEAASEVWQRNANEWRSAMSDKDKLFVTKVVYDLLVKRVDDLETLRDISQGKASQISVFWLGLVSVVGLISGLLSLLKLF
jgi:hypothetical protein